MKNITHVTIHHDPEGRCNSLLRSDADKLRNLFADGFVVTTQATLEQNKESRNLLERTGLKIIVSNTRREGDLDTKGDIALVAGYTRGKGDSILLSCLDRTLHWIKTHPDELKEVLERGLPPGIDLVVIGRTPKALATHPKPQLDAEMKINKIAAESLGIDKEIDVTTGCRLISRKAAEEFIHLLSKEYHFSNAGTGIGDSLIPFLVQEGLHKRVAFVRVEGLEWETPDQYPREIAELGYDQWVLQNFSPENINRRNECLRETIQTLGWWKEKLNSNKAGKETLQ